MIISQVKREAPRIIEPPRSRRLVQQSSVRVSVKQSFAPQDGSLCYELIDDSPQWLFIDEHSGLISGKTPSVQRSAEFKVTVRAKNKYGAVVVTFKLLVTATDFIKSFSHFVRPDELKEQQDLEGLKVQQEELDRLRELFDYLQEEDRDGKIDLKKLLEKYSADMDYQLSSDVTYKDFATIISNLNPDIHTVIDQLFGRLSDREFSNLVRQGSQPLGCHPIHVWNYLGAPQQQVWSAEVRSVIGEAVAEVVNQREASERHHLELATRV